jgi:UDP-3-O-[3-hydroxymyristoyl] glucosamine N-acyltransferase
MTAAGLTLAELASRCGGEVRGDAATRVQRVATIQSAASGSITFLANAKYRRYLTETQASAVILSPEHAAEWRGPALITKNPYVLYARVAATLSPLPPFQGGVHPRAIVDPSAKLAPDAWIGPGSVVEAGAEIGPRCFIGPNCVIGRDAKLDEDCRLTASVMLCHEVVLGKRVLLNPGVVIGGDGFGIAPEDGRWIKVPQLGSVRIGDDVEIGANTTVDRGALEDTLIEEGVKLDNLVQIGHGARIGAHTVIAGCVAVAGSANIGKHVMIAGMAGVNGHIDVVDNVVITAMGMVINSITEPGIYSSGIPIDTQRNWRKNSVRFRHLDEMARRLTELEKKLKD